MEKNNFLKAKKSAVVLLAMMMSLTSCQGLMDAIIGTVDSPTTSSQQTGTPTTAVVKTESGVSITANTPGEITGLLDQIKSDIASKGESEYEVKISNSTVEATSSDNVIIVPKVVGSNVNLNFENGVESSTTLIVKAAETASTEPTIAVNKLTITAPDVDERNAINLTLDMPETTVALKTSGTKTVYDEVVATTAINTLYIYPGVWIKSLRVNGGTVVVKEGGSIETYVYPGGKVGANGDATIYASYNTDQESCGIEPIKVNYFDREIYEISVNDDGSKPYFIKNLKVIKGLNNYAHIRFTDAGRLSDEDGILMDIKDNYPIETLTIGDGAAVLLSSYPQVKNIVGEGEQTAIVSSDVYFDKPDDSEDKNSENYVNLAFVQKMSNVILDTYSPKGFVPGFASISEVPLQLENCLFNNWSLITLKGSKSGNDFAKNCDFSNIRSSTHITIKLEGRDFNKAVFENCKFKDDTNFMINVYNSDIKVDKNGNRVYEYYYHWWDSSGHIQKTKDKDEIPSEKLAVGQTDDAVVNGEQSRGYWVTKVLLYEDYDISDKSYTFEFNDCVLPNPMIFIGNSKTYKNDLFIYDIINFLINGQSYKVVFKSENGFSTLVLEKQ